MATASLGVICQRAGRGLKHATVPKTASYFYLLRGNPRNYPITSCPCTHLRQRLFLEQPWCNPLWLTGLKAPTHKLTNLSRSDWFQSRLAGDWFRFKVIVAVLRCLLQKSKGKRNKEKCQESLLKTVQKLLKFDVCVQEIHWPDQQKQKSRSVEKLTSIVHLATSATSIWVFEIEGIPQLIVHLSHADTLILHSCPTWNDRSSKAR